MIDKLNNRLSGVYLVEIKWGLVWFKDAIQQTDQSMKYEKFINLLLQKFNEDQISKINEMVGFRGNQRYSVREIIIILT